MRCGNHAGILEIDEKLKRQEIRCETPRTLMSGDAGLPPYFLFDQLTN
jgi:hypothetical protein